MTLDLIAQAIGDGIMRNPNEVFLIEGHTDATGNDTDNLSLSDRRAGSVARNPPAETYGISAGNLVTQGYGSQYPKIPSQAAERANRRVTLRRITPLLSAAWRSADEGATSCDDGRAQAPGHFCCATIRDVA